MSKAIKNIATTKKSTRGFKKTVPQDKITITRGAYSGVIACVVNSRFTDAQVRTAIRQVMRQA